MSYRIWRLVPCFWGESQVTIFCTLTIVGFQMRKNGMPHLILVRVHALLDEL